MLKIPQCSKCLNKYKPDGTRIMKCKAFPAGIPEEIILNEISHKKPYPGDNGILFELDVAKHNLIAKEKIPV